MAQPTSPIPGERRVAARRQPTAGTGCRLNSPPGQVQFRRPLDITEMQPFPAPAVSSQ
jgi:hypothetical protein